MLISGSSQNFVVNLSNDAPFEYSIEAVDYIPGISLIPTSIDGRVSSSGDTILISSASVNAIKKIKTFYGSNSSESSSQTVKIILSSSSFSYEISPNIQLGARETFIINENSDIKIYNRNGVIKKNDSEIPFYTRQLTYGFHLTGTLAEGTGHPMLFYTSSNIPSVQTPNGWSINSDITGRITDCSSSADRGIFYIPPSTGSYYFSEMGANIGLITRGNLGIVDVVWGNTMTSSQVTTTTEQIISSSAFPARDNYGQSKGVGYQIAIICNSATTNAGVISNTTVRYTNSDGVPNRTANLNLIAGINGINATLVVGSFVIMKLQSGDIGVQSIQGITLGTSLVSGSISLIVFRDIITLLEIKDVYSHYEKKFQFPGVRIYNGSVLVLCTRLGVDSTTRMPSKGYFILSEVSDL